MVTKDKDTGNGTGPREASGADEPTKPITETAAAEKTTGAGEKPSDKDVSKTDAASARDAQARDTVGEKKPGEGPGKAKSDQTQAGAKPGDAPSADASSSRPKDRQGTKAREGEAAAHVPLVPPRPAPRGPLLQNLSMGAVGGVIGAVVIGLWTGGSEPSAVDGPAVADRGKALEGLSARVDQAESGLAEQKAALAALKGTAPDTGEPVGSLAELATKVAGLEKQGEAVAALQTERSRLAQEVARLSAAVVAMKATVAQDAGDRDALASQLQGVVRRLAALETQLVELAARDSGALRHADLSIAFANLRRVVDRGGAFRAELDVLKGLAPEDADLSILASNADKGVPTIAALSHSFRQAAHAALDAEAAVDAEGLVDRILANARSLVKVRRTVPGEGEGTSNLLARMSQSLNSEDLPAVVADGEKIDGAAAAALEPWLASVKARLAVEQSLQRLQGDLVGGGAPDGKPQGEAR